MRKITIIEDGPLPKVVSPTGRLFENAQGGPYKYGLPLEFNHAAARRMREL